MVEMVQKQKEEDEEDEDARRTATTWMDRSKIVARRKNTPSGKRRRRRSQNEKYIFVKTKDFEPRNWKDVDPRRCGKTGGCRYHEVRCARRFVCAEIACVDDEEKVSEEKCVKQRYAKDRTGEDARAGSRIVCGSYVEVRMLDRGRRKDAGDAKRKRTASMLARSDADVENDRKKLIRISKNSRQPPKGL